MPTKIHTHTKKKQDAPKKRKKKIARHIFRFSLHESSVRWPSFTVSKTFINLLHMLKWISVSSRKVKRVTFCFSLLVKLDVVPAAAVALFLSFSLDSTSFIISHWIFYFWIKVLLQSLGAYVLMLPRSKWYREHVKQLSNLVWWMCVWDFFHVWRVENVRTCAF